MLEYVGHAFRAMCHKLLPTAALAVVFLTTHEGVREKSDGDTEGEAEIEILKCFCR